MNPEKLNVTIPEGKDRVEVVIREVDRVVEQELPVLEPDNVEIIGNITAPFAFLEKRWSAEDGQINHCRTHILVNRDKLEMTLIVNETDKRNKMLIVGNIELSRQFEAFGINKKDNWDPIELANFFKIYRSYFEKPVDNMILVSSLKGFKAKVHQTVEREEKDNGGKTDVFRQVVDSSLPKEFMVNIPVFKGQAPSPIKVEIMAHVHGHDFALELISADAADIIEQRRDAIFNGEIEKIKTLAPEIPIIEI